MIRRPSIKFILLASGTALVAYGYRQLAVPPDAPPEVVTASATRGMYSVLAGGALLMFWLARR